MTVRLDLGGDIVTRRLEGQRRERAADGVRRREGLVIARGRHRLVVPGHRIHLILRFLEDRVLLAKVIQVCVVLGDLLIGEVVGGSEIVTFDGLSCDDCDGLTGGRRLRPLDLLT